MNDKFVRAQISQTIKKYSMILIISPAGFYVNRSYCELDPKYNENRLYFPALLPVTFLHVLSHRVSLGYSSPRSSR